MIVVACAGTVPATSGAGSTTPFAVPADVGALVVDGDAFAAFARDARPRLVAVPGETREDAIDRMFMRALLDALAGRWPDAVAALDAIVALQDDPLQRAMTGLTIRVWADALAAGGESPAAFRAALDARLATLPMPDAIDELRMLRTMAQVFTPELCRQLAVDEVGPRALAGVVSLGDARTLAFQRYAVVRLVPVAAEIDAALARLGIEPMQ
jgi:hypothetical protein